MAGKILATKTITNTLDMVYQSPADSGITDLKVVVNNYSPDVVRLYAIGAPGRAIVGGELQWSATGVAVTEDEKKQRALCVSELKQYERLVDGNYMMGDGDQIRCEGEKGVSNVILFGDLNIAGTRIEDLKVKVLAHTITASEKEELMLLSNGSYNYNVNNCSCP